LFKFNKVNELTKKKLISDLILEWGHKNYRKFSWRRNYNPYKILVAELLLRRTTATAVERVYNNFIELYPNLLSLSIAKIDDIEYLLKSIGYYKLRAKIITEIAKDLIMNYGEIPCDYGKLMSIKNIGNYTAGAIMSLGYEKRAVMVDSNVKRIIDRVFSPGLSDKFGNKDYLEICEKLLPQNEFSSFNLALLDFGSLICRPKNPLHERCPIKDFCEFYRSIYFRGTS
jgi:A/G-specific adenine glycosylase